MYITEEIARIEFEQIFLEPHCFPGSAGYMQAETINNTFNTIEDLFAGKKELELDNLRELYKNQAIFGSVFSLAHKFIEGDVDKEYARDWMKKARPVYNKIFAEVGYEPRDFNKQIFGQ